ncbi:MAG: hypothetical protein FWE70_08625 [Oscillospiraceae bacterium]|nr:hypothetical protein [Oscillospiraceae bacterium]
MVAKVRVDPNERIGVISPLIYGQFLEHAKDFIYPSLWDDASPHSDEVGLRRDVTEAVRELGTTVIRWPGGSYADYYRWEDGVGPRERRPLTRNWNSGGLERNAFGTDEFLRFCELTNAAPYINANLGTGTMMDALRWLDYCNGGQGTPEVLLRREGGHRDPYAVTYWGIGNETWAGWEAGQMDAAHYARTLRGWAQAMRRHSPYIKVLGVGSNVFVDGSWDDEVLGSAADMIDYLTIHQYGYSVDRKGGGEFDSVAYAPAVFAQNFRKMLDRVQPHNTRTHCIRLALDEWNTRHFNRMPDGTLVLDHHSPRCLQDAVFAAGVLNVMVRLSPHVGMANYVLLLNGNGTLHVHREGVVKTPLYHVFRHFAERMRGWAVATAVEGDGRKVPEPQMMWPGTKPAYDAEYVTVLDAAAALDDGSLTLSLINRSLTEGIRVMLEMPDGVKHKALSHWQLAHGDVYAYNDVYRPDEVRPETADLDVTDETPEDTWVVPPHSVKTVTFRLTG